MPKNPINHLMAFHNALLNWYDMHGRTLPWRVPTNPNPYYVWISEIMLQQTTVPTVKGYFEKFIRKWPSVEQLATSSLGEVLHMWQGLGYYARARNLYRCVHVLMEKHNGNFPRTKKELLTLPGIGSYTAAAIESIAFQQPAVVVDANVERVISRLYAIQSFLPAAKEEIHQYATALSPLKRPGDYAQALMDLGSMVCTPKSPQCTICPIASFCKAAGDTADQYPRKKIKQIKPVRKAIFFWIENGKGEIFLEERPHKGLLGGMKGLPSYGWDNNAEAPLNLKGTKMPGTVNHTFTHFHLEGKIIHIRSNEVPLKGEWAHSRNFHTLPLPTLMKKAIQHALKHSITCL